MPPKVLVVRIDAPAAAYASWMAAMRSGCSTFQSSPAPPALEAGVLQHGAHRAVDEDGVATGDEGAESVHGCSSAGAPRVSRNVVTASGDHSVLEPRGDRCGEVGRRALARRPGAALPAGQVGVAADVAQPHRRLVDRLLEALVQRHLDLVAAVARDDHRGEVPPVRDLVFGHYPDGTSGTAAGPQVGDDPHHDAMMR